MLFIAIVSFFLASVSVIARPEKTALEPRQTNTPFEDDFKHNYTFCELEPRVEGGGGPPPQPYFRFLILFKKKEGITEEYFHQHWATVHADITMRGKDVGVQLLRYVQFHISTSHRNLVAPLIGNNIHYAPYDGVAEFLAQDVNQFRKFIDAQWADPVVAADIEKFVDTKRGLDILPGWDGLVYGKGLPVAAGRDGVQNGKDGIMYGDRRLTFSEEY